MKVIICAVTALAAAALAACTTSVTEQDFFSAMEMCKSHGGLQHAKFDSVRQGTSISATCKNSTYVQRIINK